jgi:hypothetical protein
MANVKYRVPYVDIPFQRCCLIEARGYVALTHNNNKNNNMTLLI